MDTFELVRAERLRLADELEALTDDDWGGPSLCAGWSAHVVAAHLNLPWEVSGLRFLVGVLQSFGSIDRTMDRFSRGAAARLPPPQCVEGLRRHAGHRFTPPLAGPETPLTDVVVHGADILVPLGRRVEVDPAALRVALDHVTGPKAKATYGARPIDGLRLVVTDLGVEVGDGGAEVRGPALAVSGAVLRRDAFLDELDGPGVALLRAR